MTALHSPGLLAALLVASTTLACSSDSDSAGGAPASGGTTGADSGGSASGSGGKAGSGGGASGGTSAVDPNTILSGLVKQLRIGWSGMDLTPDPIEGAEVCLSQEGDAAPSCVTTGADGVYEFAEVPKNVPVTLELTAEGYLPWVQHTGSGSTSRNILDFRMVPTARVTPPLTDLDAKGAVLVEIGDSLSGGFTPRVGTTVALGGDPPLTTDDAGVFDVRDGKTGSDGLLLFWGLPGGPLELPTSALDADCAYVGDEDLLLTGTVDVPVGAMTYYSVMCGHGIREAAK